MNYKHSTWLCLVALLLASALAVIPAQGQSIVQSWPGIAATGAFSPPDPHGAPGPDGVIATVNLQISYFTKSGSLIWGATNLTSFFVGNTGITNQNADPRVVFDHGS